LFEVPLIGLMGQEVLDIEEACFQLRGPCHQHQSAVSRSLDLYGSWPESGGLWYKSMDSKRTICSHSEGGVGQELLDIEEACFQSRGP